MYIKIENPLTHCPSCNYKLNKSVEKITYLGQKRCSKCITRCYCGTITYDDFNDQELLDGTMWCERCEKCCMCPACTFYCCDCGEPICTECKIVDNNRIYCGRCFEEDYDDD